MSAYEKAWRTPGTAALGDLFTPDVVYSPSPWAEPVVGLDALARFWEDQRHGPDEDFEMKAEVLAVEMETAVVRVEVDYRSPPRSWRDLWVLAFSTSARCARFEEWPFAAGRSDGDEPPA